MILKEKVNFILLIILTISLVKIAFVGISVTIKTNRIGGIPVDVSVDSPVTIEGSVLVEGTDNAFAKPIGVNIE